MQMASPPTKKDIERRAYQLWQQAGMPGGRDQEFYSEAERQLKEEFRSPRTQDAEYAVEPRDGKGRGA
ncbi:DUF2934 domain-containing protein [Bradyrhizobium sp. BWC-3-1]|nr:DUF2934 domain-containing protein [Bradyrhizobium sp. BWC-3-1]WOH56897.1 DUF2934 domain-containing protein [Bradyrhizobium sp. BWC-3-1]